MEEKIYNIILHKDVDYDSFWNDMETITNLDNIPNREVGVANRREASYRQTWYYLTEEEKRLVEEHPSVLAVELPPEFRDDVEISLSKTQTGNFTRLASDSQLHDNYGLLRCSQATNIYQDNLTVDESYKYTLDGTGVDIVIQDSGVDGTHPEFSGSDGSYRVVDTDWATLSGLTFSNSDNNLTDYDGHGTHVAGTAAGLIFGHAKNAMIYPQKISGLEGSGDPTSGVSVTNAFDSIKLWHRNKPVNTQTGFKRPTIVNMSWGYSYTISTGTRTLEFRGATTSSVGTVKAQSAGVNSFSLSSFKVNARVSSVDIDVEELIQEGVHVVIAAGNRSTKIELTGSIDYDNTISSGTPRYYHRGGSPYSLNSIIVGATDSLTSGSGVNAIEKKAEYSNNGPGVDIYAPGSRIISCAPSSSEFGGSPYRVTHNEHKQARSNGTSMAAPQVTGVLAHLCQANPGISPESAKNSIIGNSTNLIDNPDITYLGSLVALHGSPQRFLRNIYAGKDHNIEFSGDLIPPFEYLS